MVNPMVFLRKSLRRHQSIPDEPERMLRWFLIALLTLICLAILAWVVWAGPQFLSASQG
jgi:hypothetical protein